MLGSCNADIDAILLLDELASGSSDHRDENQVEFSSLRAIDRKNLVVDFLVGKSFSDGVLLCIVGGDHIDRVLGKFHQFLLLRVL